MQAEAKEAVDEVIDYLFSLAPDFFAARVRPATAQDLVKVEAAARTPMSAMQRAFMLRLGNTPPRALNPWLLDRDWSCERLVETYVDDDATQWVRPEGLVYFSSSLVLGANIYLRHGPSLDDEPEVGDWDADAERLVLNSTPRFVGFLQWYAFNFRLGQPDHQLSVSPLWNYDELRWEGNAQACRDVLETLGLTRRFKIVGGVECWDAEGCAAHLYDDASMMIASDDPQWLKSLSEALREAAPMKIAQTPQGERLRAPRA